MGGQLCKRACRRRADSGDALDRQVSSITDLSSELLQPPHDATAQPTCDESPMDVPQMVPQIPIQQLITPQGQTMWVQAVVPAQFVSPAMSRQASAPVGMVPAVAYPQEWGGGPLVQLSPSGTAAPSRIAYVQQATAPLPSVANGSLGAPGARTLGIQSHSVQHTPRGAALHPDIAGATAGSSIPTPRTRSGAPIPSYGSLAGSMKTAVAVTPPAYRIVGPGNASGVSTPMQHPATVNASSGISTPVYTTAANVPRASSFHHSGGSELPQPGLLQPSPGTSTAELMELERRLQQQLQQLQQLRQQSE